MSKVLDGSINLMELKHTGVVTIKGLKCVIIPCEENDIFVSKDATTGKAKAAYLGLSIREKKEPDQWGKTHYIKQSFTKEFKEALSSEEAEVLKNTYLGNLKTFEFSDEPQNQVNNVVADPVAPEDPDDLPF
jgi:hypothetical protein